MLAGNAFGWPYFGQAYGESGAGGGGGGSASKSDSDLFSLLETYKKPHRVHGDPGVDVAITETDTGTFASGTPSIAFSDTDTAAEAETLVSAIAEGPTSADAQFVSLSDLVSTLTASISDSDLFSSDENPEEIATPTDRALNDSDLFTLADLGTNSSGGQSVGPSNSFYGVVIAFTADTFDDTVTWVRLDDPAGVS